MPKPNDSCNCSRPEISYCLVAKWAATSKSEGRIPETGIARPNSEAKLTADYADYADKFARSAVGKSKPFCAPFRKDEPKHESTKSDLVCSCKSVGLLGAAD